MTYWQFSARARYLQTSSPTHLPPYRRHPDAITTRLSDIRSGKFLYFAHPVSVPRLASICPAFYQDCGSFLNFTEYLRRRSLYSKCWYLSQLASYSSWYSILCTLGRVVTSSLWFLFPFCVYIHFLFSSESLPFLNLGVSIFLDQPLGV